MAVSSKPEPCRCRAFALKMFITLFWSPVKSLLQLLFLASYLCSALQDTVEQTVIYSRNFTCKIHNCRRFPFTPCSEHSNFTCMVMVTVCVPQTWWADILYLPQLLSLPLCLSILFFALIFVGKYVQKKMAKKSFDAQSALAHVNYKPFYSYFGR